MARIIFADDGIEFDGRTLETRPLGGVESSVIALVTELARRGHDVSVRNNCAAPMTHEGVDWQPIHQGGPYANVPRDADLYIANRGHRLLDLVPGAKAVAFWTHNPCSYVVKWRYLWRLWKRRPAFVFIGDYHADTLPGWVPTGPRRVIPYGLPEAFLNAPPNDGAPKLRAVFTSNPLRGLDWLVDLWVRDIHPKVPGAELHVFSGAATYGSAGSTKAREMETVLEKARAASAAGIVLRGPVPKAQLIDELRDARMMLYRGDLNETYCLAVAEAQMMGVPAVVQNHGSMPERVVDGETGFVAGSDSAFAEAAVRLFNEDALWRRLHESCLRRQRSWSWADAAERFEELIPS